MSKDKIVELARLTEAISRAVLKSVEQTLVEEGMDKNRDLANSILVNVNIVSLAMAVEAQTRGISIEELLKLDRSELSHLVKDAQRISVFLYDEIISKKNPNVIRVEMKPEEESDARG